LYQWLVEFETRMAAGTAVPLAQPTTDIEVRQRRERTTSFPKLRTTLGPELPASRSPSNVACRTRTLEHADRQGISRNFLFSGVQDAERYVPNAIGFASPDPSQTARPLAIVNEAGAIRSNAYPARLHSLDQPLRMD